MSNLATSSGLNVRVHLNLPEAVRKGCLDATPHFISTEKGRRPLVEISLNLTDVCEEDRKLLADRMSLNEFHCIELRKLVVVASGRMESSEHLSVADLSEKAVWEAIRLNEQEVVAAESQQKLAREEEEERRQQEDCEARELRREILREKRVVPARQRTLFACVEFSDEPWRTQISKVEIVESQQDARGSGVRKSYLEIAPESPFLFKHSYFPEIELSPEAAVWAQELEEKNEAAKKMAATELRSLVEDEVALRRKKHEEMVAWITAHGSDHLKECLAENIQCHKLYLNERLRFERPSWKYVDLNDYAAVEDPRNPTLEALALLRQARVADPAAALYTVSVYEEDPETGAEDTNFYFAVLGTFLEKDVQYANLLPII